MLRFKKIIVLYLLISVPLLMMASSMASVFGFQKAYAATDYPVTNVKIYKSGGTAKGQRNCHVVITWDQPKDILKDKDIDLDKIFYEVSIKEKGSTEPAKQIKSVRGNGPREYRIAEYYEGTCNKDYILFIDTKNAAKDEYIGQYREEFKLTRPDSTGDGSGCVEYITATARYFPEKTYGDKVKSEVNVRFKATDKALEESDIFWSLSVDGKYITSETYDKGEAFIRKGADVLGLGEWDGKEHTITVKMYVGIKNNHEDKPCGEASTTISSKTVDNPDATAVDDSGEGVCDKCGDTSIWGFLFEPSNLFSTIMCRIACGIFIMFAAIINAIINLMVKVSGIENPQESEGEPAPE